jgi:hypothetical protein
VVLISLPRQSSTLNTSSPAQVKIINRSVTSHPLVSKPYASMLLQHEGTYPPFVSQLCLSMLCATRRCDIYHTCDTRCPPKSRFPPCSFWQCGLRAIRESPGRNQIVFLAALLVHLGLSSLKPSCTEIHSVLLCFSDSRPCPRTSGNGTLWRHTSSIPSTLEHLRGFYSGNPLRLSHCICQKIPCML